MKELKKYQESESPEEINASIHKNRFSFEEKIEILKQIKEQGKELSEIKIKDKTEDGKKIGVWVSKWRTEYSKGNLSEEEIKQITELGIDLEAQREENLSNAEKIEYLKGLKEKGKELSEIKIKDKIDDGKKIGVWVNQFRTAYGKGNLSEEEIKQITELGIDLEIQREKNLSNAERIEYMKGLKEKGEELSKIKYRDKTEDGKKIGVWVSKWRTEYSKGNLSEEEIKQITELGIDLEAQREENLSNAEKIEYLKELKKKGKKLSKIKYKEKAEDGKKIGVWVIQWRNKYRKGNLSEQEIKQLTELGIKLSLKEKQKKRFERVKNLYEQYEKLIGEEQELK